MQCTWRRLTSQTSSKMKNTSCEVTRSGVTNLFETESYFLVQSYVKGYQFDTHATEINICSISLQLCYH